MQIEAKLEVLGLKLPELFTPPAGTTLPFSWVRVRGNRAYISGHAPQNPDGSLAQPLGKVGADVSTEEAYQAARLIALAMLGSLKRELGDLDRVTAWLRVHGMVNSAPGFTRQPAVINGFSEPDYRIIRTRSRSACPLSSGYGRTTIWHSSGDRGRGRDQ